MQTNRISFYDQISRNKRNSIFLIMAVGIMIVLIGYVVSLFFSEGYFFFIMIFAIIFSLAWTWGGYYNSDKIAIRSANATKINPSILSHRQFQSLVESLTIASGMPMPKLYVMKSEQINAFATGRDPKNAAICVTTGCLEKLNKQELEGVLAHELAHIANYDIRFMTLATILIGIVSIMAELFLRSLFFSSGNRNSEGKGGAILIIAGLVLAILAPIFTALVQMAISRKREFVADATAVKFTRTPTGLIQALDKIKQESKNEKIQTKVSSAISPLFITKTKKHSEWFSTHPPLEKRIELLKKM